MDYIVGNIGLNSFYKASEKYPVYITAKDYDKNGSFDAIPSVFLPDQDGVKKEFPAIQFSAVSDLPTACGQADIIVCATGSTEI